MAFISLSVALASEKEVAMIAWLSRLSVESSLPEEVISFSTVG